MSLFKKALKKIKNTIPLVKKGKYHGAKDSFGSALDQTNELNEEITELLASRRELREEIARRDRMEGPNPQPNPDYERDDSIHDLEAENYLLREVNEALIKEKAELEKVISSLETDKQQQKEEFEKQLAQSQHSIENIEHQLVECCSKCLDEEGEAKEIDKAKKEIFQLCERLGVELSPQLREDIEKASTYKNLLSDLIKIHNARMIEINQEGSEEETKPTISQAETSGSKSETSSGVKYFLWITGILALISFVLFIIRRGKLRSAKKPGKKQK